MAQLGHRSRFAKETFGDVSVSRKLRFDDLDCDRSFEIQVGGKVNSTHAAGPEFAFYSEPASDKLGDIHIRPSFGLKGRNAEFGFWTGLGEETRAV